eukprot:COSAG01_NODE_9019_length_2581_cov_1.538276_2_plen_301_part_00
MPVEPTHHAPPVAEACRAIPPSPPAGAAATGGGTLLRCGQRAAGRRAGTPSAGGGCNRRVRTRRRRGACHASPAASSPGTPQATTQLVCHLTGPAGRQHTPTRVRAHGLAPTAVDVAAAAALPALLALPVLGWCWPINIAGGTGVMITAGAEAPGRALLCGPCMSWWQPKSCGLEPRTLPPWPCHGPRSTATPLLASTMWHGSTHGAVARPEARRRGRHRQRRRLAPRAWTPCSDGIQRYLSPPCRRCDRNVTRPSPAVAAMLRGEAASSRQQRPLLTCDRLTLRATRLLCCVPGRYRRS